MFYFVCLRMCGEKSTNTVYSSRTNQITVKFYSDMSYVDQGFSAEFEAFEPNDRMSNNLFSSTFKNVQFKYAVRIFILMF